MDCGNTASIFDMSTRVAARQDDLPCSTWSFSSSKKQVYLPVVILIPLSSHGLLPRQERICQAPRQTRRGSVAPAAAVRPVQAHARIARLQPCRLLASCRPLGRGLRRPRFFCSSTVRCGRRRRRPWRRNRRRFLFFHVRGGNPCLTGTILCEPPP